MSLTHQTITLDALADLTKHSTITVLETLPGLVIGKITTDGEERLYISDTTGIVVLIAANSPTSLK